MDNSASRETMTRRSRLILVATLVVIGCGVGWLGFVVHHVSHHGEGPRRSYPLAGNAVLTDEQAIALAKQTLQLDGRFSEAMELYVFGDGSAVNRGGDPMVVSLSWRDPGTYKQWYVQLRRMPERVEAFSNPGK